MKTMTIFLFTKQHSLDGAVEVGVAQGMGGLVVGGLGVGGLVVGVVGVVMGVVAVVDAVKSRR